MKILAVDCTAKPASVAVLEDGKVLSSAYTNTGLTHSQTLVPMVDSAAMHSCPSTPSTTTPSTRAPVPLPACASAWPR